MSRSRTKQETDDPAREVARAVIALMAKDMVSKGQKFGQRQLREEARAFFQSEPDLEFWGGLADISPDVLRVGAERVAG